MPEKREELIFSKTTTLISIILGILGVLGIVLTPANANFIILGIGAVILFILIQDKISQIDENTETIKELHRKFDLDYRLHLIEKDIAEQKGKLAIMGGKK